MARSEALARDLRLGLRGAEAREALTPAESLRFTPRGRDRANERRSLGGSISNNGETKNMKTEAKPLPFMGHRWVVNSNTQSRYNWVCSECGFFSKVRRRSLFLCRAAIARAEGVRP